MRWIAIALSLAAGVMLWPLWQALVLAAWFAALARPLMATAVRVTRGRQRAAAALTLLLLLFVLVPVGLLLLSLVSAAAELVRALLASQGGKSALEAVVSAGGGGERRLDLRAVVHFLQQYGGRAASIAATVLGATATGLLGLLVFVLASHAFLADGPRIYAWAERYAPLTPAHLHRFTSAFVETGRGLLVGLGLTALVQGAVATVTYLVLGVPRAIVLGALTAVASLIPSVGTALVWVPIAAGLALTGRWATAIALAAVGTFVIGLVDNVLRPVLSRYGALRLPTFVLFVAMFGGLATVGAWGLLLGPLVVRLAVEAVEMQRDQRPARAPRPGA